MECLFKSSFSPVPAIELLSRFSHFLFTDEFHSNEWLHFEHINQHSIHIDSIICCHSSRLLLLHPLPNCFFIILFSIFLFSLSVPSTSSSFFFLHLRLPNNFFFCLQFLCLPFALALSSVFIFSPSCLLHSFCFSFL